MTSDKIEVVRLWNTPYDDYTPHEPEPCGCDADPDHGPHHQDGTRIVAYIAIPAPAWAEVVDALKFSANAGHRVTGLERDTVRALLKRLGVA